jgi:hypothetical protein
MQGTIAVLMALSGLGCHHKSYDVAPVAACYSACYGGCYGGCYALSYAAPAVATYPTMQGPVLIDGCYGGCYATAGWAPACYASACYDACYGGCYGGRKRHGLFACLFGGHKHRRAAAWCPPPAPACYTSYAHACYGGGYSAGMPVYGDYTPAYVTSGPIYGAGQVIGTTPQATSAGMSGPATGTTPPPPPVPDETTPPVPPEPEDAIPPADTAPPPPAADDAATP